MDPKDHDTAASPPIEPAWRALIESKWEALRRQVLGVDSKPQRKLSEITHECQSLAAIAAWYESHGNITHAAKRLGTSRKALRERLVGWCRDNPQLVPPPPQKQPRPRKPRVRKRKSEASKGVATTDEPRGALASSNAKSKTAGSSTTLRRAGDVHPRGEEGCPR